MNLRNLVKKLLFLVILFISLLISSNGYSQDCGLPPPPPPSGTHGTINNGQTEGGAPIGNGTIILLSLSVIYGIYKFKRAGLVVQSEVE